MPSYPDISDYTDSVQNAVGQVIDPILRNAKPRLKGNKPEMMSGGVAVVYPFQDGGDIYAVKCWLRDIGDLRDHYRLVQSFLNSCKSAYFVDFAYVEKGIIAEDQIWPFLRMKWVGGKSLLEFVSVNVLDGPALRLLAERYLRMSQRLHILGVAHGDLQGSNIKVVGSGAGIDFQLIDYDTLIVPAAHGRKADALALPSYQHPKRGASRCYIGKEDYFSELVIYLSLLAVAERPSMWSRYPKGDKGLKDEDRHDKEMLFVKEDFLSEQPTEVFKELFELSPLVKNLTLILWNFTRRQTIEQLLPLEEAVKIAHDFVERSPHPPKTSVFEGLLSSLSGAGIGWLEDSVFVKGTQSDPSTTQMKTAPLKAASFEELLAAQTSSTALRKEPIIGSNALPPPLPQVSRREFTVRMGGFFFGTKYRLTVNVDTLAFKHLGNGGEIIFDPAKANDELKLRNPWTSVSDDHIVFNDARRGRCAFSMPVSAWPVLRDWRALKKQLMITKSKMKKTP